MVSKGMLVLAAFLIVAALMMLLLMPCINSVLVIILANGGVAASRGTMVWTSDASAYSTCHGGQIHIRLLCR